MKLNRRETVADKVEKLGPGDSVNVRAAVQLNAPFGGKLSADLSVQESGGDYYVSAELDGKLGATLKAQLGVKLSAEAFLGAAVSATFKYDEVEEAQRGVEALVPFGKGSVDDLKGALSRLELQSGLNLELEAKLGFGPLAVAGKGRLDPSVSWALVFEDDGTYLEREHEVETRLDTKMIAPVQTGEWLFSPDVGKGQVTAAVTWASRMKLPEGANVRDVAALTQLELGEPVHTVSAKWETEQRVPGDDKGRSIMVSAEGVGAKDVAHTVAAAIKGDVDAVVKQLGEGATVKSRTYVEKGADWEVDLGIGPLGVEVAYRNELRDYDE